MNVVQRMKTPTPKFYKVLRNIGLGCVAAGGVLVASPVVLPLMVITLGQYLIVAGTVASAISQTTIKQEEN